MCDEALMEEFEKSGMLSRALIPTVAFDIGIGYNERE